jgi:hypothetical protein
MLTELSSAVVYADCANAVASYRTVHDAGTIRDDETRLYATNAIHEYQGSDRLSRQGRDLSPLIEFDTHINLVVGPFLERGRKSGCLGPVLNCPRIYAYLPTIHAHS